MVLHGCATARPRRASSRVRHGTSATAPRPLPGCPVRASRGSFEPPGVNPVEAMGFDLGHVCALLRNGTVRCMGENTHGELGPARRGRIADEPVTLAGMTRTAEIAVGRRITCARHRNGTVRCVGSSEGGQLGTNGLATPDDEGAFVPVQNLSRAVQLSTSLGTVCARVDDGTLRCWGREGEGSAALVPGLRGLVDFDLEGVFHGCGRFEEGSVRCGRFARPVAVQHVTQLDAGATHACARLDDGTVRCWGFNSSGQLGVDDAPADSYTPVDPGVRCVTQVVAGGDHTCVLRTDGTVWCWGGNHFGALGDGTQTDRSRAAPVAGVSNVVRLFAGGGTTCARVEEGETWCWGQSLWLPGHLPPTLVHPREVIW